VPHAVADAVTYLVSQKLSDVKADSNTSDDYHAHDLINQAGKRTTPRRRYAVALLRRA